MPPASFGQEILGIFEVFQQQGLDKSANVTLGDLVAMNIVYELTAFCTSVTAQNTNGAGLEGAWSRVGEAGGC